jgi:large subunit ribosomal protein L44
VTRRRPENTESDPAALPHEIIESNALLASLGNSLLGLFASEHLSTLYPNLPTRALKAAVSAFVGPPACFSVARELGVGVNGTEGSAGVPVRWIRDETGGVKLPESSARAKRRAKLAQFVADGVELPVLKLRWEDVVASTVRAFVALIYQEKVRLAKSGGP